ncbi:GGDEF domain protein [Pseudomonas cichorii]|uniref:diguanylate cyclase n=1 Tax=Pseudomonas cichorii TaxID=36746 RepID=A0A3M4LZW1_PSECI|nr:diguanylate cyclase [Pseudomonas cichorii]RMQ46997.1 GGDEF domain protein [Pseudomonas cichorii]
MNTQRGKGLSFAKRIYAPRTVGVSIGFFTVAVSLHQVNAAFWLWPVAAFNAFIWPHVAYQLAKRSSHPYKAEWRNLLMDSLMGGIWVGAMGFSVLPSVTVLAMMAMHNMAAGGPRLMVQGFVAQFLGTMVALVGLAPVINFHNNTAQIYACLPVLVIYPIFIGWMSHQFALRLWEHRNALSELSRTDSLTGLINHGSWKDLLESEFIKSRKQEQPSTIALIDIDHFKSINDTYGHIMGDTVLKSISEALSENLRDTDLAGRYGGDEFCIILPGTDAEQASEILERLRKVVNDNTDLLLPDLNISLSIGIAAYQPHLTDAAMWLHEADKALYIAKASGRNQVVSIEDHSQERLRLTVQH